MKFIKSFAVCLFVSMLLVGTNSIPAFAATNADFITALRNAGADSNTITSATNYLNSHTVSSSNLSSAISTINSVKAKYPNVKSVNDYNALSTADQQAIATDIKAVAADLGASVSKNSSGSYTIKDSSGASILTFGNGATTIGSNYSGVSGTASNTTGTNYGNMIAIGSILLLLAAIAIWFLAYRKRSHD